MTANLPAQPTSEPCNRRTELRWLGLAEFGPMPKPNQAVGLLVCVAALALGASSADRRADPRDRRFALQRDDRLGARRDDAHRVRVRGREPRLWRRLWRGAVAVRRDPFYDANYAGATAAGSSGAYHRAFTNGTGRRQVRRDAQAEAAFSGLGR